MSPVQVYAVACLVIVAGFALTALSYRLAEWTAALEERSRRRDAAAFFAQLAAMTESETRTLRGWADRETARNLADGLTDDEAADLAWDDICGVVGLDRSEVAARIRDRIAANEARRFDADDALRRWDGGAA